MFPGTSNIAYNKAPRKDAKFLQEACFLDIIKNIASNLASNLASNIASNIAKKDALFELELC